MGQNTKRCLNFSILFRFCLNFDVLLLVRVRNFIITTMAKDTTNIRSEPVATGTMQKIDCNFSLPSIDGKSFSCLASG